MVRKSEPVAHATIKSFLHEDQGKASVRCYTAVNDEVRVMPSEKTTQIGSVRVEMHVIEDKDVKSGQIYQKDVFMKQIRDGPVTGTTEMSADNATPNSSSGKTADGLTPLQVLKNFVDNIASDVRLHTGLLVGIGILAAAGIVIAILK